MEILTTKQIRFIEEYLSDFNAAAAARRAGYSENTAKEMGYENLTKPHVKAEIDLRLKELQLGAEETKKLIADISKGNANKYLKIVKTEYTPRVEKTLTELIQGIKAEIDFEGEYAVLADFGEGEYNEHLKAQQSRRNQILRYELELKRNPEATRIVYGKTQWIETTEFDLVALAKDKEAGKIKSFKMTKDGPHVELYPADAALTNMARIHGLFVDKSEIDNKVTLTKPLIIDWGDDEPAA